MAAISTIFHVIVTFHTKKGCTTILYALITVEYNLQTAFYHEDDVIFFSDMNELIASFKHF